MHETYLSSKKKFIYLKFTFNCYVALSLGKCCNSKKSQGSLQPIPGSQGRERKRNPEVQAVQELWLEAKQPPNPILPHPTSLRPTTKSENCLCLAYTCVRS